MNRPLNINAAIGGAARRQVMLDGSASTKRSWKSTPPAENLFKEKVAACQQGQRYDVNEPAGHLVPRTFSSGLAMAK